MIPPADFTSMTDNLTDRLVGHYNPLIQDFIADLEGTSVPEIESMPEPFLPLFGDGYERSALKLVIIGQDTRGWGDLRHFIAEEKVQPGIRLRSGLGEFQDHAFTGWGSTRHHFWGFAMMFIAALHGQEDWGSMKQGAMAEVLDSFAWGNGNAVEYFGSSAQKKGVPWEFWDRVMRAGDRFNRFRHITTTLQPHAAIVLWKKMNPAVYFEGLRYEEVPCEGDVRHYRLPDLGTEVFHAPHPGYMKFVQGADHFCAALRELFLRHGLTSVFPEFLNGQEEARSITAGLLKNAPSSAQGHDKYEFVAWMADELKKRDTFMSVPALVEMVNARGYRTNYGTEFQGGRGSYRLVSGTYHRMMEWDYPERAHNVAVAFRRPNFEYAYRVDD